MCSVSDFQSCFFFLEGWYYVFYNDFESKCSDAFIVFEYGLIGFSHLNDLQ